MPRGDTDKSIGDDRCQLLPYNATRQPFRHKMVRMPPGAVAGGCVAGGRCPLRPPPASRVSLSGTA